ncbi:hypothetical protein G3O08_18075 [Cryomorpha ignava]|uniref:Uncharacterized protein n=1 Tax=Cryomorpha ignava TaxID=101383 RepID=A0A7K3WV65_9FLAO|nr:hypothetical protein [Cryomorpha ignava]NEN25408.1 hypothetical protein [Cryomorpha ignava]
MVNIDYCIWADLLDDNVYSSTTKYIYMSTFYADAYTIGMKVSKFTKFKDRNFALQKQELSGSTFYIMDEKTLDPPTNISGQINMVMSKSEYDAITIPSNLDTTIHAPLLSFQNFSMEADNNQVPYRKAALKVNGATSNGTTTTAELGVDLLTFNYGMLNSEAAGNVVELKPALSGILTVDEFIEALKVVEDVYSANDAYAIQTSTRIRRHYYGEYNTNSNSSLTDMLISEFATGHIFEHTLPLAKLEPGYHDRNLGFFEMLASGFSNLSAYSQLTSHANENGTKDNPSPYLVDNLYFIDLGQVLYGFESIFYQKHYPPSEILASNKPAIGTYSPSYENFPVKIVNDLAGWIANVIIPVTDFFIWEESGKSPYAGDEAPDTNFNAFYDYSAPRADLYGSADSIGIYRAYQVLNDHEPNEGKLKLSDVFTLYYKGEAQLRSEINLPTNPSYSLYTAQDRWKIFSLYFGFLAEDGTGGYIWVPDSPNWTTVKGEYSASTPSGKNYDKRLFDYAEFWLTRRKREAGTGFSLLLNNEIDEEDINRFSEFTEFEEPVQWVESFIQNAFENKFLPFIKNLTL